MKTNTHCLYTLCIVLIAAPFVKHIYHPSPQNSQSCILIASPVCPFNHSILCHICSRASIERLPSGCLFVFSDSIKLEWHLAWILSCNSPSSHPFYYNRMMTYFKSTASSLGFIGVKGNESLVNETLMTLLIKLTYSSCYERGIYCSF